jgi:hypothetical protein
MSRAEGRCSRTAEEVGPALGDREHAAAAGVSANEWPRVRETSKPRSRSTDGRRRMSQVEPEVRLVVDVEAAS